MFLCLAFKAKKHTDLLSLPGTLKTYYKIDIFSAVISLRSKRFSASSSRKLGREQKRKKKKKKKLRGRGRGRGEKETLARKPHDFENLRLPTNVAFDWCGAGSIY